MVFRTYPGCGLRPSQSPVAQYRGDDGESDDISSAESATDTGGPIPGEEKRGSRIVSPTPWGAFRVVHARTISDSSAMIVLRRCVAAAPFIPLHVIGGRCVNCFTSRPSAMVGDS